jgi:acetoin utilization protein AcuB
MVCSTTEETQMQVKDVMSKYIIAATPATDLRAGMEVMDREKIRHLPVVDEDGVLGVLSRHYLQNLVTLANDREEYENLLDQSVESFLATRFTRARDVVVVHPDDSLRAAIDLMLEERLSALPVVDKDGDIAGVLSYVDVLEALKTYAG